MRLQAIEYPDVQQSNELADINKDGSMPAALANSATLILRAAEDELRRLNSKADVQEPVNFESIIDDILAIDCRYRGDPSYDQDAYWMKDEVIQTIRRHASFYANQPAQPTPVQEPVEKLRVTLQDSPIEIELAQYKRMFEAACSALGEVSAALGCDPNEGGSEPLIEAIERLKSSSQEPIAMRYDFDGHGYKYIDNGSGSDWQTRIKDAEPVYAAPVAQLAPTVPALLTDEINAWYKILPDSKAVGQWESSRQADYANGWNDYRKEVKSAIEAKLSEDKLREKNGGQA
jgi:hypothetical protein